MPQSKTAIVFLRDTDETRKAKLLLEQLKWKPVVINEPIPIVGRLIIIDEPLLPALHEEAVDLLPNGRLVIVADGTTGKASGFVSPEVYMLYRPFNSEQLQLAFQVD